jgi:predicted PurR-regulated permease PerM
MTVSAQVYGWITGRTLSAFLMRGVLGISLIVTGFMIMGEQPYLGLFMALIRLIPLGGCPTCWLGGTIGAACEWRAPTNSPTQ